MRRYLSQSPYSFPLSEGADSSSSGLRAYRINKKYLKDEPATLAKKQYGLFAEVVIATKSMVPPDSALTQDQTS